MKGEGSGDGRSVPDSLPDSSGDFCGYIALAGEQSFPHQPE